MRRPTGLKREAGQGRWVSNYGHPPLVSRILPKSRRWVRGEKPSCLPNSPSEHRKDGDSLVTEQDRGLHDLLTRRKALQAAL